MKLPAGDIDDPHRVRNGWRSDRRWDRRKSGATGRQYHRTIMLEEFKLFTGSIGIEVLSFEIRRSEELDSVFDALKRGTDGLYVLPVPLLFANRARINALR
jgi:hypothetical protein